MKNKLQKLNLNPSFIFLFSAVVIFGFVPPKYDLTGRWSILNLDGTASGEYLDFNKDGTYLITLPDGLAGEKGNYSLKDSTFSIRNIKDVCGKDYWGTYRLTFRGRDSVHFAVMEDTCTIRKMDIVEFNPWIRRDKTK